jgi:hypothetical protein
MMARCAVSSKGSIAEDLLRRCERGVELRGADSDRQELGHHSMREMPQALALGEHPAVEILLAEIEALQEIPVVEALYDFQTFALHRARAPGQRSASASTSAASRGAPEELRIDTDELLAEGMSHVRNGLAQAVPCLRLFLVSPQKTRDGLARDALVRAHGEIRGEGGGFASGRAQLAPVTIFESKVAKCLDDNRSLPF